MRNAEIYFSLRVDYFPAELKHIITQQYPDRAHLIDKYEIELTDQCRIGHTPENYNGKTTVYKVIGLHAFWEPDYPLGNWPKICVLLLALLTHEDVLQVWYGSDDWGSFDMTINKLQKLNAAYLGLNNDIKRIWDA